MLFPHVPFQFDAVWRPRRIEEHVETLALGCAKSLEIDDSIHFHLDHSQVMCPQNALAVERLLSH